MKKETNLLELNQDKGDIGEAPAFNLLFQPPSIADPRHKKTQFKNAQVMWRLLDLHLASSSYTARSVRLENHLDSVEDDF